MKGIWAIVLHLAVWNENIVERTRTATATHPSDGAWPALPQVPDGAAWELAKNRLRESLASVRTMLEISTLEHLGAGPYGLGDLLCRLTHNGYHLGQITELREWMKVQA